MNLGVFDLFKVGIGPSSSHTTGPMRAAGSFVDHLAAEGHLERTERVTVELFGSLGATGRGHLSVEAIVLGLAGARPETVDPALVAPEMARARSERTLELGGTHHVGFDPDVDVLLHAQRRLAEHSNGMEFRSFDGHGELLSLRTYFSVGGGFVVEKGDGGLVDQRSAGEVPYPFSSADELLEHSRATSMSIADLVLANEAVWRPPGAVRTGILELHAVMEACIERGCEVEGELPGWLHVERRAPGLARRLATSPGTGDPLEAMEWVMLWALAVNEENATGGRVVTAPTNGAAGIIPAVARFYLRFVDGADEDGLVTFFLTASAIGVLFKQNASISGAEVGCQGEVGSACSMAAAGLAAVLGGSPAQVENAAEIGIEHNLGLTCDPVGGLVQIPCIERNAVAAIQAITAARMALLGTGHHQVSLDRAIKTMKETGADMQEKYKETSRGGLALNVIEC